MTMLQFVGKEESRCTMGSDGKEGLTMKIGTGMIGSSKLKVFLMRSSLTHMITITNAKAGIVLSNLIADMSLINSNIIRTHPRSCQKHLEKIYQLHRLQFRIFINYPQFNLLCILHLR